MIFCRRSRAGFSCFCLPHFFSKEDSAFAGGGPRGSALGLEDDSDGKPCSGVRGGQQASTASVYPLPPVRPSAPGAGVFCGGAGCAPAALKGASL